jgi:hypothetical protein
LEENKKIVLPSKKFANAPDEELDLKLNLDTSESLLRIGERDIVLDVAKLYSKERNDSINYKIYGKLKMVFRNLYCGNTDYTYLKDRLYLIGDGTTTDHTGFLPYDEFAFMRRDVYREVNLPITSNTVPTGFTSNIVKSGSTAHTNVTPINAPYQNWNLYLSYVYSGDTNFPMKYSLTGSTYSGFTANDGIPFRVTYTGGTYYELTSPVEHGMTNGDYIVLSGGTFTGNASGRTYSITSVGNEIYGSEKYVVNILKSQIPKTKIFNTIMFGKRCLDINNIIGSTSTYYVHKHKTLTNVNGYILDKVGFETPIWEDEKKLIFENFSGDNDVLVERNRMESVLYDFKEPFKLSGLTNNLGFTPTEVYVTALFRNGNGYFNYPPKVGYKFNFHDTWIDQHFNGTTSIENGMQGNTTTFTGATSGFTFTGGTELSVGTVLNGAFVEYNPKEMKERIVSESFHKITNPTTIFDYGQTVGSSGASINNLEGLIYQPHYRVKLRELSPYVETATTNDIFNLPENTNYDADENVWRWRDLYDQGYVDQDGYGTNFPFVNGTHYVRTNINFYLRNERYYTNKQDGVTNFNNRKNINC